MKTEEIDYNGVTLIKTEAPIVGERYSCDGCVFYKENDIDLVGLCTAPTIESEKYGHITDPRYDCLDGTGIWIFYKKK